MEITTEIINALKKHRFNLHEEKIVQSEIANVLTENNITFEKEYRLDPNNIPDFFISGVAVEVKIKGNAKKIYKQVERYAKFDEVKELILITNRSMGFPQEINGKSCYVINLGKAWL